MLIYLNSTPNLGDFLNSLPVLSGIHKTYGKFDFVIRGELRKFNGIKELLLYQDLFNSVDFDDDVFLYGDCIILSSWTRETKSSITSPTETCRYENWLLDNYPAIKFVVDNDYILKVPDYDIVVDSTIFYSGDRWSGKDIDSRRKSNVLTNFTKLTPLDFTQPLSYNAFILKNTTNVFTTTFTGIAVLADLLGVNQYVVWGDDLFNWDNKPIEESFYKHFYANRNSKLININEFTVEYDRLLH